MKIPTSQISRPYLRNMNGIPRQNLRAIFDDTGFTDSAGSVVTGGTQPDSDFSWLRDTAVAVVGAWNQQKILELNLERARQGLPLIDAARFAPTYNVGMSPEVKSLVTVGMIGIGIFLLLKVAK